jgi:hypothetical protein
LVRAIHTAKCHGIDVLIDAVTNVRFFTNPPERRLTHLQHKLGADGKEEVRAVEVHAQNRNHVIGPEKIIEVSYPISDAKQMANMTARLGQNMISMSAEAG